MWRSFAAFRRYFNTHINKKWCSRNPYQLHKYTFYEVHFGVLFAVTCNRLLESPFFIENLSIECSVNFIRRRIGKELTGEDKLLQTLQSSSSHYWLVRASTNLTKPSGEQGTLWISDISLPHIYICVILTVWSHLQTQFISRVRESVRRFSREFFKYIVICWPNMNIARKHRSLFRICLVT